VTVKIEEGAAMLRPYKESKVGRMRRKGLRERVL